MARLMALKSRVAELRGATERRQAVTAQRIGVFRIVGKGRFTLEGNGSWTGFDTATVYYLNRVFNPRANNGATPGPLWMRAFDAAVRRFNGIVVYRKAPQGVAATLGAGQGRGDATARTAPGPTRNHLLILR